MKEIVNPDIFTDEENNIKYVIDPVTEKKYTYSTIDFDFMKNYITVKKHTEEDYKWFKEICSGSYKHLIVKKAFCERYDLESLKGNKKGEKTVKDKLENWSI